MFGKVLGNFCETYQVFSYVQTFYIVVHARSNSIHLKAASSTLCFEVNFYDILFFFILQAQR